MAKYAFLAHIWARQSFLGLPSVQVLQVKEVKQVIQVMHVRLAHMWVDFRVIQLCHRLHKRISKKNNEKQENDPAVKTSNLPKAESAAQKRFAP